MWDEGMKSTNKIVKTCFLREWVEREARKVEQLGLTGLLMSLDFSPSYYV